MDTKARWECFRLSEITANCVGAHWFWFPQAMSCWASTASIWLSSPTMRPFLWWRLKRLSPRWYSVSSRPSLRTPRRTKRRPAWTKWTLRTINETTLSIGRPCGLAGWACRGTTSITQKLFRFMKDVIWPLRLPFQSPPLVQGHRLTEDQQRELGL